MISQEAKCAQEIRKVLKKEFPKTKFKVIKGYSGVDISWEDGIIEDRIYNFLSDFRRGWFDSMHDIYISDNINKNIIQVDYISATRTISDKFNKESFNIIKAHHMDYKDWKNLDDPSYDNGGNNVTPRMTIKRLLKRVGLTNTKEISLKVLFGY